MNERTIVVSSEDSFAVACLALRDAWEDLRAGGKALAVRLYPQAARRKLVQQGLMWLRLQEIAEQVWIAGCQFSVEAWHVWFKRECLPEEDGPSRRVVKGYRKWRFLPDGSRELTGSTTQLTVPGMAEYVQQIEVFGAGRGVRFSAAPGMEGGR